MCTDNSHDFVEITEHKEAFTFDVEVARKILNARDALILNDVDEAYHQLCAIADPTFTSLDHWKALEVYATLRVETKLCCEEIKEQE